MSATVSITRRPLPVGTGSRPGASPQIDFAEVSFAPSWYRQVRRRESDCNGFGSATLGENLFKNSYLLGKPAPPYRPPRRGPALGAGLYAGAIAPHRLALAWFSESLRSDRRHSSTAFPNSRIGTCGRRCCPP